MAQIYAAVDRALQTRLQLQAAKIALQICERNPSDDADPEALRTQLSDAQVESAMALMQVRALLCSDDGCQQS